MNTAVRWIIAAIATVLIIVVIVYATRGGPASPAASATPADLGSATYSLFGDTFSLSNGSATIQGHSGLSGTPADTLVPVGYTLAATSTASGDLNGDGVPDEVAALYRGFGANLQWVTLFAFSEQNGALTQIASGVAYQGDSKVESVSVSGGVVTLNLLVASAAA